MAKQRPVLAAGDNWKAQAETMGDRQRTIHEIIVKDDVKEISYASERPRMRWPYGIVVENRTCKEPAFLTWVERTRAKKIEKGNHS